MIQGIPFRLIDTAGIHQAREEVEQAGIARSRRRLSRRPPWSCSCWIAPPRSMKKTWTFTEEIKDRPHFILLNKWDLPAGLVGTGTLEDSSPGPAD